MPCEHNARCNYVTGFYCEDCKTFFSKESPTYRATTLLSSIWMVLNNINVEANRAGKGDIIEVLKLKNKIGIYKKHSNYEELISEAEILMTKYKKHSNSASIELK